MPICWLAVKINRIILIENHIQVGRFIHGDNRFWIFFYAIDFIAIFDNLINEKKKETKPK